MFASFRNSTHCVCSLDSEQRKYSGHDSSKCSSYPIKQDLYKKKSRPRCFSNFLWSEDLKVVVETYLFVFNATIDVLYKTGF